MKHLTPLIDSKKSVIFSTDDNQVYYFFMPIVSKLWVKMGYQPKIFIVGSEHKWESDPQKKTVLNTSIKAGADVIILDSETIVKTREFDGYDLSALAQVSRLCFPCWPGVKESDYCLTSDIDMLPLNAKWLNQQDFSKPINIFYANGYNHTRYAICYIGMKSDIWKKVVSINTNNIYIELMRIMTEIIRYSPAQDQWGHDEIFFFKKVKRFPGYPKNCQMIDRKIYNNPSKEGCGGGIPGCLPIDRLDRSNWHFKGDIHHYVDAHCKRPGYTNKNWLEIRDVLRYVLDNEEMETIDKYYKEFMLHV